MTNESALASDAVTFERQEVYAFLANIEAQRDGLQKAKALFAARLAPDFTVFEFIKFSELSISSVLAWLLDPKGTHAQGNRFLKSFLDMIGYSVEAPEVAQVNTEYCLTRDSRIDVILKWQTGVLAIENKPFAADLPNQVGRYLDALDQDHHDRFRLVYLSPAGEAPPPHSLRKAVADVESKSGRLCCLSYGRDITAWLERCRSDCRCARVQTFIDDFCGSIRREFEGVVDMSDRQHLVDGITSRADYVASAMEVVSAADAIRTQLLGKLRSQLDVQIQKEEEWRLIWNMSGNLPWTICIDFDPRWPVQFSIEFYSSGYNSVAYGVLKKGYDAGREEQRSALNERIREAICDSLKDGRGRANELWPWWNMASTSDERLPMERHWGATVQPWHAIATDQLSSSIIKIATRVRDALRPCFADISSGGTDRDPDPGNKPVVRSNVSADA
jgi:hypothetical protein